MPVLEKQRWELFCIGVANGVEPMESYGTAGFRGGPNRASVYRLLQKPIIRQRIGELQQQIATRLAGQELSQIEIAIKERDGQVLQKWARWQELTARKADLEKIKSDRARIMLDPANQLVAKLGGPSKLAGVSTGLMVLEMKMLGKTAVPTLELDTALLGELPCQRQHSPLEVVTVGDEAANRSEPRQRPACRQQQQLFDVVARVARATGHQVRLQHDFSGRWSLSVGASHRDTRLTGASSD